MKYGITGGAGFVGSHLAKLLVEKGHDVVIIDNLHSGKIDNISQISNHVKFYNNDIRNFSEIETILKSLDGIFHQAALTVVQESFTKKDEYIDVNVNGTENIFKIGKKYGIKIVFASSSSVYGNVKKFPISENFPKNPINPYGQTKLDCELLAETFCGKGGQIIGLRYFNIYGIGQTNSYAGVITKFMNKLEKNESPIIFGDGKQMRDFIYVKDVALANLSAMESKIKSGFFNIGTGHTTSIIELCEIMIAMYRCNLKPQFSDSVQGDVLMSQADTIYSKNLLQWESKTSLKDGLKELILKKEHYD